MNRSRKTFYVPSHSRVAEPGEKKNRHFKLVLVQIHTHHFVEGLHGSLFYHCQNTMKKINNKDLQNKQFFLGLRSNLPSVKFVSAVCIAGSALEATRPRRVVVG